jgi:hypothetical protein
MYLTEHKRQASPYMMSNFSLRSTRDAVSKQYDNKFTVARAYAL